jgi:hypothetical protein
LNKNTAILATAKADVIAAIGAATTGSQDVATVAQALDVTTAASTQAALGEIQSLQASLATAKSLAANSTQVATDARVDSDQPVAVPGA